MPYINTFNVNEDLMEEVLRIKRNQLKPKPIKVGIGIEKTIPVKKPVGMVDWHGHLKKLLKRSLKTKVSLANIIKK